MAAPIDLGAPLNRFPQDIAGRPPGEFNLFTEVVSVSGMGARRVDRELISREIGALPPKAGRTAETPDRTIDKKGR